MAVLKSPKNTSRRRLWISSKSYCIKKKNLSRVNYYQSLNLGSNFTNNKGSRPLLWKHSSFKVRTNFFKDDIIYDFF